MLSPESQKIRTYLYNILNNNFEPLIRSFIQNHVLTMNNWESFVPSYTIEQAQAKLKTPLFSLDKFMSTLFLSDLKSIMIYRDNFDSCKKLIGQTLAQDQFEGIMDKLNETRCRVDHPYEVDSDALDATISRVRTICKDHSISEEMLAYLDLCSYVHGVAPPPKCINNLNKPSYELDGGFIARQEAKILIDRINRKLNRVINIIGSGGVGKTAIAEYICHHYLQEQGNPFYAILFYSAKEKRLTEKGVLPVRSNLVDYESFIEQLHKILLPISADQHSIDQKERGIYDFVDETKGHHRCLIVIDNLEQPIIFKNKRMRKFIEEFPRNCQILITSRIGTDLPEERIKITEMDNKQSVELLKRFSITRFRNRTNLYELSEKELTSLVDRVYRIPLLIKIAVGRHVELGQNIGLAFSVSGKKDKEAINFMLSETFEMLSKPAKVFLECMAIHKDSKISRAALIEMTEVFDTGEFEAMVQQVEAVSLVKRIIVDKEEIFVIDQIANKFVQDLLYSNDNEKKRISKKYTDFNFRIDIARSYLSKSVKIEGIGDDLKESEYLAASHVAKAIGINAAKALGFSENYEAVAKEFNVAIELAPWWYHTYMEFAFFEANKHPDRAKELLNQAESRNPKCIDFEKYQKTLKIISPAEHHKNSLSSINIGEVIDVVIESCGSRGDGVVHVGNCVVFVTGAKLGQSCKVKISKLARNCAFAEIVKDT